MTPNVEVVLPWQMEDVSDKTCFKDRIWQNEKVSSKPEASGSSHKLRLSPAQHCLSRLESWPKTPFMHTEVSGETGQKEDRGKSGRGRQTQEGSCISPMSWETEDSSCISGETGPEVTRQNKLFQWLR